MGDGDIVVSGPDVMREVQDLRVIHKWRSMARMKVTADKTPSAGWTIARFNTMYGVKVRTWAQVYEVTDDVIKGIRAELDAAKAAREAS
jgi:hypothetical protein